MADKHKFTRASSKFPICIILMIDGSGSMCEGYQGRNDVTKMDVVTAIVNDLIEVLNSNSENKEDALSARYILGIISYGDGHVRNVVSKKYGSALGDISHIGYQTGVRKPRWTACAGSLEKATELTWIEHDDLFIGGGTPMNLAFREVKKLLIKDVVKIKQLNILGKSPIPLIVNITDGEPTDGDAHESDPFKATFNEMQQLLGECLFGVKTNKPWIPIICNVYVSDKVGGKPLVFPNATPMPKVLENDEYGKWLFEISHLLPVEMRNQAHKITGVNEPEPIAFIWDVSASKLLDLIVFMSETTKPDAIKPDR